MALVTAPGSQVLPGLAFDGANYLLSWSDGPFAGANNVLKFRFFSPALQPIGSELTPFPARGTNYPFATLALFDGTQFAAIGTLANVDATFHFLSGDIYGTFIPKLDVSILVNGVASSGSVLVTNQAAVDITTTISNGVIFYTLDGAYPGIGPFYTGTLFLTQSATIRALAYAPDYSFSVEGLTVNMTVVSTPTVGVQPLAEDRLVGGTAMFTAQATGTPPLSYQWSFNGSLIPGAVNSSLLISNVQLSQAGQYSGVDHRN